MDPEIKLQILLADLQSTDAQIAQYRDFQTRAFMLTSAAIGAVLALTTTANGTISSPSILVIAFSIVIVIASMGGMFVVDKDEIVLELVSYQEEVLLPAIRNLSDDQAMLRSRNHAWLTRWSWNSMRSSRWLAKRLTGPFPHVFTFAWAFFAWCGLVYLILAFPFLRINSLVWAALLIGTLCLLWLCLALVLTGTQWKNIGVTAYLPCVPGWSPGDAHLHTTASDGRITPYKQACNAKRSGLDWVCFADHVDKVGLPKRWQAYQESAAKAGQHAGIEVVTAVEISATRELNQQSDQVWYGIENQEDLPVNNSLTQQELIRAGFDKRVLASIAHPAQPQGIQALLCACKITKSKPWTEWNEQGVGGLELMSNTFMPPREVIDRWFILLDQTISGALDGEGFPVAMAGTDAHWKVSGKKSIMWVYRETNQPIADLLKSGRTVVSGAGDFAAISIGGVGPGEIIKKQPNSEVKIDIMIAPAVGRFCCGGTLYGSGQQVMARFGRGCPADFAIKVNLNESFGGYVLLAVDFKLHSGGNHSQTWTNPIFIDTRINEI